METTQEVKEKGAASIFIELEDGFITVTHGTSGVPLSSWLANKGDWDRLWKKIKILKDNADKSSLGIEE